MHGMKPDNCDGTGVWQIKQVYFGRSILQYR